ncbi:unnamed protein product [Pedinophyceae sp. YPF-701]|nr:unnamed protein product [Pedinophyceae sp. YPF-701]
MKAVVVLDHVVAGVNAVVALSGAVCVYCASWMVASRGVRDAEGGIAAGFSSPTLSAALSSSAASWRAEYSSYVSSLVLTFAGLLWVALGTHPAVLRRNRFTALLISGIVAVTAADLASEPFGCFFEQTCSSAGYTWAAGALMLAISGALSIILVLDYHTFFTPRAPIDEGKEEGAAQGTAFGLGVRENFFLEVFFWFMGFVFALVGLVVGMSQVYNTCEKVFSGSDTCTQTYRGIVYYSSLGVLTLALVGTWSLMTIVVEDPSRLPGWNHGRVNATLLVMNTMMAAGSTWVAMQLRSLLDEVPYPSSALRIVSGVREGEDSGVVIQQLRSKAFASVEAAHAFWILAAIGFGFMAVAFARSLRPEIMRARGNCCPGSTVRVLFATLAVVFCAGSILVDVAQRQGNSDSCHGALGARVCHTSATAGMSAMGYILTGLAVFGAALPKLWGFEMLQGAAAIAAFMVLPIGQEVRWWVARSNFYKAVQLFGMEDQMDDLDLDALKKGAELQVAGMALLAVAFGLFAVLAANCCSAAYLEVRDGYEPEPAPKDVGQAQGRQEGEQQRAGVQAQAGVPESGEVESPA